MPRRTFTALHPVLLGLLLAPAAALGCQTASSGSVTVTLLARAPERGNWSPQTIRVPRGKNVTIVIKNPDVVTHGFYLPALGLYVSAIKAGDVTRVSFTPEVTGEFAFYCSVWCGDYHMQMRGKLIVE